MFEGNPIQSTHIHDYILIIIVVCAIIILRTFYLNPKMFSRILRAPFNLNESEKMLEDTNIIKTRVSFFLNLVFIINLSIFSFLILRIFDVNLHAVINIHNDMVLLTVIFGVLVLFYLLRHLIYLLVAYVSNCIALQKHYIQIWMNLNKWFGLILFPVLMTLLYFPEHIKPYIIYIFAVIFALQFAFKLLQGLIISTDKYVSLFVIFLYLCTLELLPVSILIKYITGII